MVTLIRTDDLPPEDRREAWRHVVCDTLGPLDLRIDPDAPLQGEIETGLLGAVSLANLRTTTPHSVHRTPGLVRRDSPELYRVVLPIAGSHRLAQDGRAAVLGPGDFAIYDFTRPYDLGYRSAVQLAVFAFPRALLPFDVSAIEGLTATAIPATQGAGALVAPLLQGVARDLHGYAPETAARLSTVLLDLVTTALAERIDRGGGAPESQQTLLFRVHAFIEQHLADAELTPADIAAAHHVSVRNLHRLFAADGTTVGAWIRQRRLERCRKDLGDPMLGTRPVSAIAARWGLTDSAHFSRIFRSTYGTPPSDYRRACFNPVAASQALGTDAQDREARRLGD